MSDAVPLIQAYDAVLLDLDGVLYIGSEPVPGAPAAVGRLGELGVATAYVTNNASRTAAEVAAHLAGMQIPALPDEVVTSAQATADLLAARLPAGAKVLVVGGDGLIEPIRAAGLWPVRTAADDPVAVVQGFSPDLTWTDLAEGAYAVGRGLPWIASNADLTIPTDKGIAPGNGALIEVIRYATNADPLVVGKPARTLFDTAVVRIGAERPLVVGDRLDTDIEGAQMAGLPSALVLTGVTGLLDLLLAIPAQRPTYILGDLGGLFVPYEAPVFDGDPGSTGFVVRCGRYRARFEDERYRLEGPDGRIGALGDPDHPDAPDGLGYDSVTDPTAVRALAALAWSRDDATALGAGGVSLAAQ